MHIYRDDLFFIIIISSHFFFLIIPVIPRTKEVVPGGTVPVPGR